MKNSVLITDLSNPLKLSQYQGNNNSIFSLLVIDVVGFPTQKLVSVVIDILLFIKYFDQNLQSMGTEDQELINEQMNC